jgi:hypothetical protein
MKKGAQLLLGTALATVCAATQAAIHCEGLVNYALLYSDGTVNVIGAWRGEYTYLCNTNGTWGGISAEVCLSWYALAAKAAADGKVLAVYYNTDSYTCANLPTYGSSLVPTYAGVKRQ